MRTLFKRILGGGGNGVPSAPGAAASVAPTAQTLPPQVQALTEYSMCGVRQLGKHYKLARDVVTRGVRGDLVELGVCNGGSAGALALGLGTDGDRHAWLYDSFQGMPEPDERDGDTAKGYIGACVGSLDMVRRAMQIAGWAQDRYTIREGWFDQTFKLPLPQTVAVLHVDSDWYENVMLCLNTFYDRVSEGGVVLLDDFGHWEGCREAFYDFTRQRDLKPLLERFGYTQAFWVKGRTHNRDYRGQWEVP
jgi:O-methyltransferase